MAQNWNLRVSTAVYCEQDEFGWYGVQCEGMSESGTGLSDQLQAPYGFAARPLDAVIDADGNVEQGCEVFRASLGRTHSLSWLGHDTRYNAKCPPLTKGSCAAWNATGAFLLFDYEAETATLYQPIANGTKAHKVTVGVDGNNAPIIDLLHSSGAYLTLADPSVVLRHTGSGYFEIKGDDLTANGKLKVTSGLDVGGGASLPLALATPLVSYLSELETLLNGLATAIDGKTPSSPGVSSGVVSTFLGATSAFKAAISATLAKAL